MSLGCSYTLLPSPSHLREFAKSRHGRRSNGHTHDLCQQRRYMVCTIDPSSPVRMRKVANNGSAEMKSVNCNRRSTYRTKFTVWTKRATLLRLASSIYVKGLQENFRIGTCTAPLSQKRSELIVGSINNPYRRSPALPRLLLHM